MKTKTKLIIGIIIFIIILYFGIVGFIAYFDEKNHLLQNNCNITFDYNVTKAIDNLDNNYNLSIQQIKNLSGNRIIK